MPGRSRRRSGSSVLAADEGPFVSFTDLFIGILFLFLILVAALMLMHQEAMQRAKAEQLRLNAEIARLQAELDKIKPLDPNDIPFRLAIVFNSFQRAAGSDGEWRFTRTVQVLRSPNGNCLENVILRNNLNLAWKPPVDEQEIPTTAQSFAQTGAPCALSASGERWNTATETGGVDRVSPNLYSGYTVLHTKDGDKSNEVQFRVLGVYDDYFRSSGGGRRLPPPPIGNSARPSGAISLQ